MMRFIQEEAVHIVNTKDLNSAQSLCPLTKRGTILQIVYTASTSICYRVIPVEEMAHRTEVVL